MSHLLLFACCPHPSLSKLTSLFGIMALTMPFSVDLDKLQLSSHPLASSRESEYDLNGA